MQTFEKLTYNLKQIRFKENKDFIESLLYDSGFQYTDIAFLFSSDFTGEICDKVIKYFPKLAEYKHWYKESAFYPKSMPTHCFSSVFEDKQLVLHIKKEDHKDFSNLLKKIPNSINFGFMGVVLDNVSWYKEEEHNPIFNKKGGFAFSDFKFNSYHSNSIRFFKEFDYGNKYNPVEIVIDRTGDMESLRPYPKTFNEMTLKLGKPESRFIYCVFDENEKIDLNNKAEAIKKLTENTDYSISFEELYTNKSNAQSNYLIDSITPINGFSPKKVFNKCAKAKGYKYSFYKSGCYRYSKTNADNHTFTVELVNAPFSLFFDASVSVEGYNFNHFIWKSPQITAKEESTLFEYARAVFNIAEKIENDYSDILLSSYGKTPSWYIERLG